MTNPAATLREAVAKMSPAPWRTHQTSTKGEALLQTEVVKDFASRSVQMREPDATGIVLLRNNIDALLDRLARVEGALRELLAFTDPLGASDAPMNVKARAALRGEA